MKKKVLISSLIYFVVSVVILTTISIGDQKGIPEPKVRPDVPADAVWDSELGMYISGDYVKDENGNYVLDMEKFTQSDPDVIYDPEGEWYNKHKNSDDPIDQAILKSLASDEEGPPLFRSAISPYDYEETVSIMGSLDFKLLPELWKRTCTEPAYRPQKLLAMELLLGEKWEFGLFDHTAQKLWYEHFTTMQKEILNTKDPEKLTQYGILSLPVLAAEYQDGEKAAVDSIQRIVNKNEVKSKKDIMLNDTTALDATNLDTWLMKNDEKISTLKELLNCSYEWVE